MCSLQPLKVVSRCRDSQLQVAENVKGLSPIDSSALEVEQVFINNY